MHKEGLHRLLGVALAASLALVSGAAAAKRTGQNMPCKVCHEGMDGPKLNVTFDPPSAAPGQKVKVNVVAAHPSAVVGGVFVDTLGKGELQLVPDTKTWLIAPGHGTHSEPHPYANGQVQFSFEWLAPSDVGVAKFVVWSNATNDNQMPADDSPATATAFVTHGCAGVWSYPDADNDGFGDIVNGELACTAVAGLISQGGDCDDALPSVNAGVTESCNNRDDNCDGLVDEGFNPVRHYVDGDGDGFGALGSSAIMGCSPIAGYAPKGGDCNDAQAAINPAATELPNKLDDNCDSKVDEAPSLGGSGSGNGGSSGNSGISGSSGPASGGTSGRPLTPDAPSACSFAPLRSGRAPLLLLVLAAAWVRRRRGASFLQQRQ